MSAHAVETANGDHKNRSKFIDFSHYAVSGIHLRQVVAKFCPPTEVLVSQEASRSNEAVNESCELALGDARDGTVRSNDDLTLEVLVLDTINVNRGKVEGNYADDDGYAEEAA